MLEKNKDSFEICIEFRTKLWRHISNFHFQYFWKQIFLFVFLASLKK